MINFSTVSWQFSSVLILPVKSSNNREFTLYTVHKLTNWGSSCLSFLILIKGILLINSIQENGTKLQAYWTIVEKMPPLYKANLRSERFGLIYKSGFDH